MIFPVYYRGPENGPILLISDWYQKDLRMTPDFIIYLRSFWYPSETRRIRAMHNVLVFYVVYVFDSLNIYDRNAEYSVDISRKFYPWTDIHKSLCVISLILVSLENVKKCVLGGCTITSKTKINIVWKFSHSGGGRSVWKNFKQRWFLPFEANSALSRENETKIVKITHSANVGQKEMVFLLMSIRL